MSKTKYYDHSLDHLDPFEEGKRLFKEGKKPEDHPVENFSYRDDNHPDTIFLSHFIDKVDRGWMYSHFKKIEEEKKYRLEEFSNNLPIVGEEYYLEPDSNKNSCFKVKIESILDNNRAVVISRISKSEKKHGQIDVYGRGNLCCTFHETVDSSFEIID